MTEPISSGRSADPDRDFLLRSLLDLERERAAGDLDEADYLDLKTRYEAKLAETGRESVTQESRNRDQNRRWGRTIAAAAVVVAIGIGGGLAVARWSGSRGPGDQVSGRDISTTAERLAKAASLAGEGQVLEALKVYDEVLAENPEDVAALTYKGWLLRNVGTASKEPELAQRGAALIEQATQVDPEFAEAWFFRGIIYLRDEDERDKAVDALRLALANDPIPEIEGAARELLAEIARGS